MVFTLRTLLERNKALHYVIATVFILGIPFLFYFLTQFSTLTFASQSYGLKVDRKIEGFKLSGRGGIPVTLDTFRGQNIFVFFGFTSCKTTCPATLQTMARLNQRLAGNFKYVFISVDSVRDNEKHLAHFEKNLGSKITFLHGKEDTLRQIAKQFSATFKIDKDEARKSKDYQMSHSSFLYLVDHKGRLKFIYPEVNPDIEKIITDITRMKEVQT